MTFYYGLKDEEHLVQCAEKVVDAFGGGVNALVMMLGTTCPETHLGQFPDAHPDKWGVGVGQCDQIGLDDVKKHIRDHDRQTLLELGYDIDEIVLKDLATEPVLAFSIMRLHYKRKPDPFPDSKDIEGQGRYWKKHYNTEAGKGTAEKYVKDFILYMPKYFVPDDVGQG